ncbi:serine/threonine kinase family protein [Plesiocystis pacifica SIR-1]|uniref:Serine/threonine kinase family protein n=1 Tax=Plesiocystis pacifica SIR-1 TaxID=391625 RepID=A6GAX4_9BACT|nr:serine/threonine-protein kinase [Plesiocystis pacifica]EDM76959.1 serine/threonine kinase family protein [Plesiocystis pacifica SIR-1]
MSEEAGDPLRDAAPEYEDVEAKRARAGIAAALFASEPEEAEPILVGRYRVESRLGAGGMGVVYRAHDPDLDRPVAVKLLHADAADDDRARARMQREARSLAKLSHPNVITVYDVGVEDQQVFVAMELVAGPDLRKWLQGVDPRDWRRVLEVFLAAGRGLEAAHAVGLVHRDFKPENVLVGHDGRVRVLDFGLARARSPVAMAGGADTSLETDGDGASLPEEALATGEGVDELGSMPTYLPTSALTGQLTETGALIGTPLYMAPELYAGGRAGPASDQFAFCASLYEGIYRARPFGEDTMAAHVEAVRAGRLVEPKARGSEVPAQLWRIVARGLAADPSARYPELTELLTELEALLRDPAGVSVPGASAATVSVSGSSIVVPPASGFPWSWLVAGAAVVALAGTLVALELGMLSGGPAGPANAASASSESKLESRAEVEVDGDAELEAGGDVVAQETGAAAAVAETSTEASGDTDGETGGETGAASETGSETGAADEGEPVTDAGPGPGPDPGVGAPPVKIDGWCHLHEDSYTLLTRGRRRGHLSKGSECFVCRVERRRSRTRNFSQRNCAGFSLCGPAPAEDCS